MASKYDKENTRLLKENNILRQKCSNMEFETHHKIELLELKFNKQLTFFKHRNTELERALKDWAAAINMLIVFICKKLGVPFSDKFLEEFTKKYGITFNFEKKMKKIDKFKKKDDLKL